MFIFSNDIVKQEIKNGDHKMITFSSEKNNYIKILPPINSRITFISENITIDGVEIKEKSKIILNLLRNEECEIYFDEKCVLNKFISEHDYREGEKVKITKVDDYYNLISQFENDYQLNNAIQAFETNKLMNYRYFCYKYIEISKKLNLSTIVPNKSNNCVIVEFNKYPHLEFIIRNTIYKLKNWSVSIVCCDENLDFIKNMCNLISPNIEIILYNKCVTSNEYNNMLLDVNFWNSLSGEKILLMQEDTLLMGKNIDNFMNYDYVGMIYDIEENNNKKMIMGNLGITIRNRQLMIDVLSNFNHLEQKKSSRITKRCEEFKLDNYPADMFFSKIIHKNKLGTIANMNAVNDFVFCYYFNDKAFSFHYGWQGCSSWKTVLFNRIISKKNKNIFDDKVKFKIVLIKGNLSKDITDVYPIYNGESTENTYFLYINGNFDLKLEQIRTLFEDLKSCKADIMSPVITKSNNKLEYFGAVLNNDGKVIMINEEIINYSNIVKKLAWNSYIQNTIVAYPKLFISKYKFNIEKIVDKCVDYKNVKVDPFVVVNNIDNNEVQIVSKHKNLFEINLNTEFLKDIFKNYVNFNLTSFKFMKSTYYLTLNNNKNMLFIEDVPITPDNDCGSLYMYYYLDTMIKMGYNVHFLPLNFYNHGKYTEMLNKMGIYQAFEYPYSVEYHLKNNYNVYDYIFISRYSAMSKTYDIVSKYCKKSKIIFITHDLCHMRLERENKLPKEDINRIKNEELGYINKCNLSVVVSEYEYNLLKNNKVYYSPICYKIENDYHRNIEDTKDIYFIGSSHPPNMDAVTYFINTHWNNIISKLDIKFHIIGKGFDKMKDSNFKNIIIHGFVEDKDLNNLIKKFRINIVPLRFGAGIKGKILQSCNLKIPCVSTPVGAEGMKFENGKEIIIMDFDKENFVDEFIKVYNNTKLLHEISNNCYKCMKNNYSLEKNEEYIQKMLTLL